MAGAINVGYADTNGISNAVTLHNQVRLGFGDGATGGATTQVYVNADDALSGTYFIVFQINIGIAVPGNPVGGGFSTYTIFTSVQRQNGQITGAFDSAIQIPGYFDGITTPYEQTTGTIALVENAGELSGTVTFSYSRKEHGADDGELLLGATGSISVTGGIFPLGTTAYVEWVQRVKAWKAEKGPLADQIRVLKEAYLEALAKYTEIRDSFPKPFDKVYKINRDPSNPNRGIIVERGSIRAALIGLNDLCLELESLYSAVKLGGKVTLDLAEEKLKDKTLRDIGLKHFDLPDDQLGVLAFLDKMLISVSVNYRPQSELDKDEATYNNSRRKAMDAITLAYTNLLRIKKLRNKARLGIHIEGDALKAKMLADNRLAPVEKELVRDQIEAVVNGLIN